MPYRRLPNTDAARLRAMKIAKEKFEQLGSSNVPFSNKIMIEINSFIPRFEMAINEYKTYVKTLSSNQKEYEKRMKNARLYISHFIQVLNLACIRGEIKPKYKTMYKILPDYYKVPSLNTEKQIIEWGKCIIEGEQERTSQNPGLAIYNPSIAKVKVFYDLFCEAHRSKDISKKSANRFLTNIRNLREKADELILDLWNQIENFYAELGTEEMQERSKEFGVVYYLRRKERQKLGLPVSGDDDDDDF